jgi:hypothetical protein
LPFRPANAAADSINPIMKNTLDSIVAPASGGGGNSAPGSGGRGFFGLS